MQYFKYNCDRFSLIFPEARDYEEEDSGLVTFYKKDDGVGVFQISTWENKNPGERGDLVKMILYNDGERVKRENIIEYKKGDNDFAKCEFVRENHYWMLANIQSDGRLALITYNCDLENKNYHKDDIEEIFESIFVK